MWVLRTKNDRWTGGGLLVSDWIGQYVAEISMARGHRVVKWNHDLEVAEHDSNETPEQNTENNGQHWLDWAGLRPLFFGLTRAFMNG